MIELQIIDCSEQAHENAMETKHGYHECAWLACMISHEWLSMRKSIPMLTFVLWTFHGGYYLPVQHYLLTCMNPFCTWYMKVV